MHVTGLIAVDLAGGVVSVVLLRSLAAKEVCLRIQEADTLGGAVAEVTGVANLSADEVVEEGRSQGARRSSQGARRETS